MALHTPKQQSITAMNIVATSRKTQSKNNHKQSHTHLGQSIVGLDVGDFLIMRINPAR